MPVPQTPFNPAQDGWQPWNQPPAQFPASNGSQFVPGLPFGPPGQQFAGPAQPSSPLGGFGYDTAVPQQPFPASTQAASPHAFQTAGFVQPASQPSFTGNLQTGNQNAFQFQDAQPEFPEYKTGQRKRAGYIAGIIALLILVLAASVGGYIYVSQSATSTANRITPAGHPMPVPKGTPLFSDTFMNNNNGWDLTSKPGQFSVKIGHGSLVLEDDNNKLLWEIVPGGRTFNDFFPTVDAVLSKGSQDNGYGVYIRGASNQNYDIASYYRLEMYGDGTYAVFKGTMDAAGNSNSQRLVDYTASPLIHKQGQVNQIGISAKGSTLTFYVNGQLLNTVIDNSYTSGSIALFVSNLPGTSPGAQATFSHLAIYPPQ